MQEALDSLPEELRGVYEELVEDYRFSCIKKTGKSFVNYLVLAELIRVGWRHSANPIVDK